MNAACCEYENMIVVPFIFYNWFTIWTLCFTFLTFRQEVYLRKNHIFIFYYIKYQVTVQTIHYFHWHVFRLCADLLREIPFLARNRENIVPHHRTNPDNSIKAQDLSPGSSCCATPVPPCHLWTSIKYWVSDNKSLLLHIKSAWRSQFMSCTSEAIQSRLGVLIDLLWSGTNTEASSMRLERTPI